MIRNGNGGVEVEADDGGGEGSSSTTAAATTTTTRRWRCRGEEDEEEEGGGDDGTGAVVTADDDDEEEEEEEEDQDDERDPLILAAGEECREDGDYCYSYYDDDGAGEGSQEEEEELIGRSSSGGGSGSWCHIREPAWQTDGAGRGTGTFHRHRRRSRSQPRHGRKRWRQPAKRGRHPRCCGSGGASSSSSSSFLSSYGWWWWWGGGDDYSRPVAILVAFAMVAAPMAFLEWRGDVAGAVRAFRGSSPSSSFTEAAVAANKPPQESPWLIPHQDPVGDAMTTTPAPVPESRSLLLTPPLYRVMRYQQLRHPKRKNGVVLTSSMMEKALLNFSATSRGAIVPPPPPPISKDAEETSGRSCTCDPKLAAKAKAKGSVLWGPALRGGGGKRLRRRRQKRCCDLAVYRSHKHGHKLTKDLFRKHRYKGYLALREDIMKIDEKTGRLQEKEGTGGFDLGYFYPDLMTSSTKNDFRHVLVVRNLYESIVSGYLYHATGHECWLTPDGSHAKNSRKRRVKNWYDYDTMLFGSLGGGNSGGNSGDDSNSEKPPASPDHRSLCWYLADESTRDGMRAYIDWVFRFYYRKYFTRWAWSQAVPRIRERTLVTCFEDLAAGNGAAIERVLQFAYYNTTAAAAAGGGHRRDNSKRPRSGKGRSSPSSGYDGGHATSHDPKLRRHLLEIVEELDAIYYNGEIEWLDSILPC